MSKHLKAVRLAVLVALLIAAVSSVSADIVYVNNSLGTNGSGTTPATAVNNLQDALTWASPGDTLWVTGGTYAEGVLNVNKSLEIHGGFASPNFDSRDISGNATVIDGQGVARSTAMIVVTATARIDGLTVTGGNNTTGSAAVGLGGGIYVNGAAATITSCTVTGNSAVSASYCKGGVGIVAQYAGANAMVYNSQITSNDFFEIGGGTRMGGGLAATEDGIVSATNCQILDNTETGDVSGTAVSSSYRGMARLTNCVVAGSDSLVIGMRRGGSIDLTNTTIVDGYIGVHLRDANTGTVDIKNCIFSGQSYGIATSSGVIAVTTLTNNLFHDVATVINWGSAAVTNPWIDGGGNISAGAPWFSAPNMRTWPRFADASSHDYSLLEGSVAIDRGTATGAPSDDVDGNPRAVDGNSNSPGAQVDIGAYEYQATGNWDDLQLPTLYVKLGGTGSGSSWADAYGDLGAADSLLPSSGTIWVAAGYYTVTSRVEPQSGERWYGGFPATGNPGLGDRDPWTYVTTVDYPNQHYPIDLYDNSHNHDIVLDGFDVVAGPTYGAISIGGSTNDPFDGDYKGQDYVTVRNCRFRGSRQGINILGGHITIEDCVIDSNLGAGSNRGGGMYVTGYAGPTDLTIRRCTFVDNVDEAGNSDGYSGGAIHVRSHPAAVQLVVEDTLFVGNKDLNTGGNYGGGAIGRRDGPPVAMRNCVFVGNSAETKGGAYASLTGSNNQDFVNCTFYKNTAATLGGAIYYAAGNVPDIVNSLFLDNTDGSGDALFVDHDNVNNCLFLGSSDTPPSAQGNVFGDPRFTNTTGTFDAAGAYDSTNMVTAFNDSGASYTPNALRNTPIELDTGEYSVVLMNTATMIVVAGDHSAASGAYSLLDFTPGTGSWAVDTGTDSGSVTFPTTDINGDPRDVDVATVGGDGAGNAYDIGAVERQSTSNPELLTYVDDDAPGGGDGSKAAPYQTIGEGIRKYGPGWDTSVLVAGGVYPEIVDMQEYLKVRGGFSSDFSARNLLDTPTTITGQRIARSASVVTFTTGDVDARLDGVTVTGANVTGIDGGGIEVYCRAQITSCVSTANRVEGGYYHGGAALCLSGNGADDVVIVNCEFTSNSAIADDGLSDNRQTGRVGGLRISGDQDRILLKDCYIANNYGGFASGALIAWGASVTIENTIFAGNVADGTAGGGAVHQRAAITDFVNCTFYDNAHIGDLVGSQWGSGNGDVFYTRDGANDFATFINCIFSRDGNTQGGTVEAIYIRSGATVRFGNCLMNESDFYGGSAPVDLGGNVSNLSVFGGVGGTFVNPNFRDASGHDFTLMPGSAAIDAGASGSVSGVVVPATDFSGAARDYDIAGIGGDGAGNAYDIGAFENSTIATADGAVYVDDDAAPGGDGSKLAPYQSIGFAAPRSNPSWPNYGVFVAGGEYNEVVGLGNSALLRGGYSADFSERDVAAYETVIDGQHTTRTRALVYGLGIQGARIDGFTIRRGYNRVQRGGGVAVGSGAQIAITSCTISDNWSGEKDLVSGTGPYLSGGGGVLIYDAGSYALIENCLITSNTTWNLSGYCGSGVGLYQSGQAEIRNSSFIANRDPIVSHLYGTAIGAAYDCKTTVTNCLFYDNPGNVIYARRNSTEINLYNCTLIGDGSTYGAYSRGTNDTVVRSINCIWADFRYALTRSTSNGDTNYIHVAGSLFHNNTSDTAGATDGIIDFGGNISVNPILGGAPGTETDPMFVSLPGQGIPYILTVGSAAIDAGLTTTSVPTDDIFRLARDSSPDIGANEYQASGVAPIIVLQPEHVVVDPGAAAIFSVAAYGSPLLAYQWEFNDGSGWVNVGENGAILTIDTAAEADEGSYRVTITNDEGSVVSSVVTLTVNDPPVITVEPVSVQAVPGSSASFSVTVTGTAPMTFQWQKDGALADIDSDHVVTSTDTGSTYLFTDVQPDDPGVYRVQVTNSAGMARSAYVVLSIDGPIQVLRQPTTQTTTFGADATFTIFVSGSQPMTYAWTRNGLPLSDGGNVSGATTNELTIDPVDWADAMGVGYQVTVTNAFPGSGVSPIVGIRLLPTGVSPWWEMMK